MHNVLTNAESKSVKGFIEKNEGQMFSMEEKIFVSKVKRHAASSALFSIKQRILFYKVLNSFRSNVLKKSYRKKKKASDLIQR